MVVIAVMMSDASVLSMVKLINQLIKMSISACWWELAQIIYEDYKGFQGPEVC